MVNLNWAIREICGKLVNIRDFMYQPIIGLEIHLQLATKTKLFCRCQSKWEEETPNIHICPICSGQPGILPVLNQQALEWATLFGLALNGQIAEMTRFDRKNYFYPDLPKGYQISQYNLPLVTGGWLEIKIGQPPKTKRIRIKRVHLEEDTAKLIHTPDGHSLIDFNRAGVPLLEIVTEPDFESPTEAKIFLEELQKIARYLGVSEAEMEKGQMRCDTNISLRPLGQEKLYPKAEIKNLNSFKSVERALIYETERQEKLWQKRQPPKKQSTRGWDEKKQITIEQRTKEEEQDYRYFPEPDLPPFYPTEIFDLEKMRAKLLEMPQARLERFITLYNFTPVEAKILIEDKKIADFSEKVISELKAWLTSLETVEGSEEEIWQKNKKKLVKLVANWLINRLIHLLNQEKTKISEAKITPENFAEFIILIYEKKISSTLAQKILEKMFFEGKDPDRIIQEEDLKQVDDTQTLEEIIDKVVKNNPEIVKNYRAGKVNVLQFLIGQVMKETKGQAAPEKVAEILKIRLDIGGQSPRTIV